MFKISINDKEILHEAANPSTYSRGLDYYVNNRVHIRSVDSEEMQIKASVRGSQSYNVEVDFFSDGSIANYKCTCPAYYEYDGACKHIIAVLKRIQKGMGFESLPQLEVDDDRNRVSNFVFHYFDTLQGSKNQREVKLEISYIFETGYGKAYSSLEFKIGEEKQYIIRNIKDFIQCMKEKRTKEFGKNFTYDPSIHKFNDVDNKIIDQLIELYENENIALNLSVYSNSQYSALKGSRVYLSDASLNRAFHILKERSFNARILGKEITDIQLIERDMPISFQLNQINDELVLDFDRSEGMPLPIAEGGKYFFYKNSIYSPSERQLKYFTPFYHIFGLNKEKYISFTGNEKERFASEVLPYFKSIGELQIDNDLKEVFHKEELNPKIYFDKVGDEVWAKVEFCYGEDIINPFEANNKTSDSSRILIRDAEKEKNIISLFERTEFKVLKDKIYLEDEDSIFNFLVYQLPLFQEIAEVYYSENFKTIAYRGSKHIIGKVKLNESSDLLEFSFELQDVDDEELRRIFSSIKEKKKYYRLKDGSFIPLETTEITHLAEIIDHLNIKEKDLNNKMIQLPKYRALYLDSKIREGELDHFERNVAFKQMVQNIKEPKDMDFEIPIKQDQIMREYQKIGFKWLKTLAAYGLGGILADDMGLGKTLQTIAFIKSEKEKRKAPVLVIVPTSLVYNWQDEVNKFAADLQVLIISGMQNDRKELLKDVNNADIVITSYPLIRRDIGLYKDKEFSYCFLDEAQHIKNPDSINAKSVKQIKAKGYFALTGTPIENSLTELWSIFDFIMPGYLLSHSKFVKKYETPIIKNKDELVLKELGKQIRPFILRRMKKEVLKELPEKIETSLSTELTEDQKKIYLAYLQKAKGEVKKEIEEKGFESSRIKILSILTRLRQICCHPGLFIDNYKGKSGKLQMLSEILGDALDGGHRILIFSQFTSMLGIIKEYLEKENIHYFYLDGSTKMELRGEMVKAFNNGINDVFLISLKAGGTGLNLTGADTVIHYDPWWNPAVEDQASDRAYRIGQENTVQVIKLITKGTIEEKVNELQKKKKEMIEAVISPGESPLSKMTKEDLTELFEL